MVGLHLKSTWSKIERWKAEGRYNRVFQQFRCLVLSGSRQRETAYDCDNFANNFANATSCIGTLAIAFCNYHALTERSRARSWCADLKGR